MKQLKNEHGYQLLEIVLSLSLLSIVLLVFFGFFFQAKTFTVQNQKSGSASQLSQELLAKALSADLIPVEWDIAELTKENWEANSLSLENWQKLTKDESLTGEYSIEVDKQIYFPKVKIIQASMYSTLFSLPKPLPDTLDYIQVELWVEKNGVREKIYETYGYKVRP